MTLQDNDLLVVSRAGVQYHVPYSQLMSLQNSDLLYVSRGGVGYYIPAQDLQLTSPPAIGSVVLSDQPGGGR